MSAKIMALKAKLGLLDMEKSAVKQDLQKEYNKVFDASKELGDAIAALELSNEYTSDEFGDIASWHRFYGLNEFSDCREYLEAWLADRCIRADWTNDCLMLSHGNDNLIIQDDTRRDNGVWLCSELVIAEVEYKTDDGEIDADKRNALIEAYMESTGYFPGVFRCDSYGNVYLVNTQAKGKESA